MVLQSWLPVGKDDMFSIANIPFGIISTKLNPNPRGAIAIGSNCLDLDIFAANQGFSRMATTVLPDGIFREPTLNDFAALGRSVHRQVRRYLQDVLRQHTPFPHLLRDNEEMQEKCIVSMQVVTTHLPMRIGNYTDFYAGLNHARNAGTLLRGAEKALQPNYTHMPVAYHGRASSIVVSHNDIHRPWGQVWDQEAGGPVFRPSRKLDFELEMGAFLCKSNEMGKPIPVDEAEQYIFGYVLLNDWSARDIQAWEYQPLGPFNGKNFATTISPWIVLADAIQPFRCASLENKTDLLPYLREKRLDNVHDIEFSIGLAPDPGRSGRTQTIVSQVNSRNLLFSFPQMLAHHTVSGCPMQVGDLLGSGTISGTEPRSVGSLLEMSHNGKHPIDLDGVNRTFLEDSDEVIMQGRAVNVDGDAVGFGSCVARIRPAMKLPHSFGGAQ